MLNDQELLVIAKPTKLLRHQPEPKHQKLDVLQAISWQLRQLEGHHVRQRDEESKLALRQIFLRYLLLR